ncbi:hypothetical protein E2C01_079536 [Portunus trituberculatus]|uniref:Uncharacterized protein n=1 Tax=Portunus trituberculatus TaxID=210409 RepID=A0A5B7IT12_PORTR|nr:hypothetical protein [Portunus trituberculatus]
MNMETRPSTEGVKLSLSQISHDYSHHTYHWSSFHCTRTRFHINFVYYLVILHSFRNLSRD